ncbi:unnamed protein product, partial [Linum tenue]
MLVSIFQTKVKKHKIKIASFAHRGARTHDHKFVCRYYLGGVLALIPVACKALPVLMACILLSNIGASITEVAKDALVAEYGQKHRIGGLQSYASMAFGY